MRPGPFGETLDTFTSRAFAVCDHQLAHVYVADEADRPRVRDVLAGLKGVARVLDGEERDEIHLRHERSGEMIALAEADAWFAYPFWLDDRQAPDYARTVDIHRKPGFDPCELFFDPRLVWPKGRALLAAAAKETRLPHAVRRGAARRPSGARQSRPSGGGWPGSTAADRRRSGARRAGTTDDGGTRSRSSTTRPVGQAFQPDRGDEVSSLHSRRCLAGLLACRVKFMAVLMSPTCVNACGKLPTSRPVRGSYSSEIRPTSLHRPSKR